MSGNLTPKAIRSFFSISRLKMHAVGFAGFFVGAKIADFTFYDEDKMELLREDMEEEFWAQHGKPTYLKSELVPSYNPTKKGQMRESYICVTLQKDALPMKVDALKEELMTEEELKKQEIGN